MLEKDFQSRFTRWAKHNIQHSCAVELKVANGKSLPFNAVADHQYASLLASKQQSLVFKIPDVGYDVKPFDCFVLSKSRAYIGILFYEKRGDKEFYLIDIENFIQFRDSATRKSILRDDAKAIASIIGELKY